MLLDILGEQTCAPFDLWQVSPWADNSLRYFGANILLQMCKYVHSHWVTSVFVRTSVCSCMCVWSMYVGICLQTSFSVSVICESMHICTFVCVFAWPHSLVEDFMYLQKYSFAHDCVWIFVTLASGCRKEEAHGIPEEDRVNRGAAGE